MIAEQWGAKYRGSVRKFKKGGEGVFGGKRFDAAIQGRRKEPTGKGGANKTFSEGERGSGNQGGLAADPDFGKGEVSLFWF